MQEVVKRHIRMMKKRGHRAFAKVDLQAMEKKAAMERCAMKAAGEGLLP